MLLQLKISTLIIIAIFFLTGPASSQEAVPLNKVPVPTPRPSLSVSVQNSQQQKPQQIELSLSDAVFLGIRTNRTIKSNYISRVTEKFDLRVAEDRFTPKFSIDGSLSRQRITGVHTTNYDVSPGVTWRTPLGTTFDFSWNVKGASSLGQNTLSNTMELSVTQPLLRGAGVEVNMAPVNTARLQEKINRLRLKTTVSTTIGTIILAHRDLIAAQEEMRLAQAAVKRGEELLEQNRLLIAAGRMADMDAVQTEADLENQKLRVLHARQMLEQRRLELLDLLNLDLSTVVVAKENFTLKQIPIDLPRLFEVALKERQDYQGQIYVLEQNRLGIKVAENEQLWDISLFAQGTYGTYKETSIPDRNISDGSVGLRLKIPINDLSRKQKLVSANTSYQTAELQLDIIKSGIERQVRTSATEVQIYWQQAKVAQTSLDLAQRALDVEKAKLNSGRSSTFEVRSMEQNLRDAETQQVNARINYLNALTRLDLQLGTTLETWQITLND